jgi:hypothetical protein
MLKQIKPNLRDSGFKTNNNNNTEIAVIKTLISGGSRYGNTAYMSFFMESM